MFRNRHGTDHASRPALTLSAVAVVQLMVSLDLSVVNVGLPEIAAGLDFGASGLTWVIHAYALTFGGLLLLGGRAADRYGRRRVLCVGLALFAVASLVGGLAQTPGQLVDARALQGVGAAALAPAALAVLTSTFPSGPRRARAFGVWSATNAAGGALGVLVGGLLVEVAGWRSVMLVNLPIVAIALVLSLLGVTGHRPSPRSTRPDVAGAVLVTAGLALLVLGVVRTDQHPWTSTTTLVTLALALALLVGFVRVERSTTREPLLRLGLLTRRSVAGANLVNLLVGGAMASAFYFMTLHLQRVQGVGPAAAGVRLLPFALGVVAGSVLAVRLGRRLSSRSLLVAGSLLTAAGFAWFAGLDAHGTFTSDLLGPSVVASLGFGLVLGPVVATATAGVAEEESGIASGLLASSRQVGASLGLAALGTVAASRAGGATTVEDLTDAHSLGFALCAALLAGAALIAAVVLPRTSPPAGGLLRPFAGSFTAVLGLQALAAVAGMLPLFAVVGLGRQLLEPGAPDPDRVVTVVALAVGGLVGQVVLGGASSALGHVLDTRVQLALRRRLAAHLGRVPLGWLAERRTGELAKVVDEDVSAVHPFIAHGPAQLVSAFVVPLVALSYLLTVDWQLTLITLVPVLLAVAVVPLLMTPTRSREQHELDRAMGEITSSVVEFVHGIAVVKAYGTADRAHGRFLTAADDFVAVFRRWVRGVSAPAALMNLALSAPFVLLVVLVAGVTRISGGSLTTGDLIPFVLLGPGLTAPVAAMGHGFDDLQAAGRAVRRIREVLATDPLPEPQRPASPCGHEVRLHDVHFAHGEQEVLHGVDATFVPGRVTAVVGPSGSGKSTLAQLVARLADPAHGAVTLGGTDLRELGSSGVARHVSLVLQHPTLLRATVAENIALAVPDATRADVIAAAERAHVHERVLALPEGYDTVVHDRSGLSLGERQRLAIARALLADTAVLVLDEATAFADPLTDAAVRRTLSDLDEETTVIVIAHRPDTILTADAVVVLREGRVVERGSPRELAATGGELTRLLAGDGATALAGHGEGGRR